MLDLPRDEVERLCRRFGVARLAVFGSAVTDEFDPERSDLDVLVESTAEVEGLFDAYFGLREALEALVGRQRSSARRWALLGHPAERLTIGGGPRGSVMA